MHSTKTRKMRIRTLHRVDEKENGTALNIHLFVIYQLSSMMHIGEWGALVRMTWKQKLKMVLIHAANTKANHFPLCTVHLKQYVGGRTDGDSLRVINMNKRLLFALVGVARICVSRLGIRSMLCFMILSNFSSLLPSKSFVACNLIQ